MNKLFLTSCFVTSILFVTTACTNNSAQNNKSVQHEHAEHDHSSHVHTEHTNSASEQNNTTDSQNSKAEDTNYVQGAPSATIPTFTFYKLKSGISFTNQDIPKGKKTAFILFDPGCSHCRDEAAALGKNYDKIKDVNLYFVSMNDPALMATFLETFAKQLVNKPNVEVLYDRNQEFIQKFHVPKQFPANYIYTPEGKIQEFWDGDKNINDIITAYTK